MRHSTLFLVAVLVATPGFAKLNTVKGAKCTACHEGKPAEKKFNKATVDMMKKYAEPKCKDCHGAADGKLTTTEAGKKAHKK